MLSLFLKKSLAEILFRTGITDQILKRNRRSVILTYHHVLPDNDQLIRFIQPGMYVLASSFKKHLTYLKKHFNIIPLDHLVDLKLEKSCIITFDDGWSDNYTTAYPILIKHNVPATIFIATNKIGSKDWPWPDKISLIIHGADGNDLNIISKLIFEKIRSLSMNIPLTRGLNVMKKSIFKEEVISIIKNLPHEEALNLVSDIQLHTGNIAYTIHDRNPWLSWNEINEMSEQGISFNPHTHNHVILTNVSPEAAEKEVFLSQQIIAHHLKKKPSSFSYPNGNYNSHIISIMRKHGISLAVTTAPGTIDQSASLLTLKRNMLHDDISHTIPMLAYKLAKHCIMNS